MTTSCPMCNLKVGTYDGRINYHTVAGQPGGEECPASHTHIATGPRCDHCGLETVHVDNVECPRCGACPLLCDACMTEPTCRSCGHRFEEMP